MLNVLFFSKASVDIIVLRFVRVESWIVKLNVLIMDAAITNKRHMGDQEWRSSESSHLPPMCPGLRLRDQASYVGWVCSWFSPCYEGFSPGTVIWFSFLHKKQHLQIPIEPGQKTSIKSSYGLLGSFSKQCHLFRWLEAEFPFRRNWWKNLQHWVK